MSVGGDAGRPVALEPGASPAAAAFARIATALDAVAPHQLAEADDMSGCSARLLAAVGAALEADAPARVSPGPAASRRHLVTLRLDRRSGHAAFSISRRRVDQIRGRGGGRPRSA